MNNRIKTICLILITLAIVASAVIYIWNTIEQRIYQDYDIVSCQAKCYDKYYPNPFFLRHCVDECYQKYSPPSTPSPSRVIPWKEFFKENSPSE